jgi:hypothetical protein
LSAELKTSVTLTPEIGLSEPQLPVLRFRLRHMFWCMTGTSVLLAALVLCAQADGVSPLALLLAVIAVLLHLGGTAIGIQLRSHANDRRAWEAGQHPGGAVDDRPRLTTAAPVSMPSGHRSPLHGHERLLRRLPLFVLAGAIIGACLGLVLLTITIGGRTTPAGMAVGAISTAVLGAWIAFVAASSWTIMRRGWRDAVADEPRE